MDGFKIILSSGLIGLVTYNIYNSYLISINKNKNIKNKNSKILYKKEIGKKPMIIKNNLDYLNL